MRIILLGAPGSGKGTQGEMLAAHYGILRLSTGDALRAAVALGTALGREAQAAMGSGQLVDDRIVVGIVEECLAGEDAADGFILDGFPRNARQAQTLETMLGSRPRGGIDAVLHLDVPDDELMQRLLLRGIEQGRNDDNEATIHHRLVTYRAQTEPLLAHYAAQGRLLTCSGVGSITAIFGNVVRALDRFVAAVPG